MAVFSSGPGVGTLLVTDGTIIAASVVDRSGRCDACQAAWMLQGGALQSIPCPVPPMQECRR